MGTKLVNALKRVNYFNHQFLQVDEFTDEQEYHLRLRRSTNRLHGGGIAWGLDVAPEGTASIRIEPGLAIDIEGREIVLLSENPVDLSGEGLNREIFLTVSHGGEQTTDPTDETGAEGDTRVLEKTRISWLQSPPADTDVLLAKVVRRDGGITIDKEDRKELNSGKGDGTNGFLPLTGGTLTGDLNVSKKVVVNESVKARTLLSELLSVEFSSDAPVASVKNNRPGGIALRVNGRLVVNGIDVQNLPMMSSRQSRDASAWDMDGCFACRCVNGSGRRLARGDVVTLKRSARDIRFVGDDERIPLPVVEHAREQNDTGVFGVACRPVKSQSDNGQGQDLMAIDDGEELLVITQGPIDVCQVDASGVPINVGDLLTTSDVAGHARKATDPRIGAVLGKALQPLQDGQGSIAIFVNTQ